MKSWTNWTTFELCGIHRSLIGVRLLWFSSCHWKCSGAVVVLQKRDFANSFKPIFSLVVLSRLFSRASHRPCMDGYHMFDSAAKNCYNLNHGFGHALDSHNCRHSVQLMLCFCWPIYCHSFSFSGLAYVVMAGGHVYRASWTKRRYGH